MRVLHIINSLNIGGAEKLLTVLLPEIKKQGTDVELLLLNKGDKQLFEELSNQGILIHCLNVGYLRNPLISIKLLPYLKGEYDIIHAHLFPTQYWITFAKLISFSKTKLVFTEHNTTNSRISSPYYSVIDKWMYTKLEHLVCITKEIEDIYLRYQPKLSNKTTIIHNGVPIDVIRSCKPLDLSSFKSSVNDKILFQVAGFRPQKQQETLVEALSYLPHNFKILFAGDGPRRAEIEEFARERGFAESVFFLGNRNDVYSLQKSADYIILSTHYEGLSLACIEGMASGKPFLASDVKGVHNLVSGAGLLFEEGNAKQLAELILQLEYNSELKAITIKNCEERASRYSIEECARKHIELYKSLIPY
ncbi:glycosyltransferase [Porphyromonas levii]|uniref:glycosyltransferase n=1 Tax=Porphyromonas levii TaxID=28114 RepID=UPI001B8B214F|nr:glycosyltransferase [Porphyromonas levii]MBR8702627.1 putative glycosyltransferase EpsF [Porphyromonas levii]MBR8730959.1 putative glycosyltransferase EpsF [Porphyromonas levii]